MTDKYRRLGLRLLQIVVTIGLMLWLLRQVSWSSLLPLFADLRWGFVALNVVFLLLGHLINVARWQYLLPHRGLSYVRLLAFYGAGLFGNSFLPTGFGGDSVRVVLLSQNAPVRHSFFSVGLDRVIGFIALSALLGLGLWTGPPPGLTFDTDGLVSGFREWDGLLLAVFLVAVAALFGLVSWIRLSSPRSRFSKAFARFDGTVDGSQWTIGRWVHLLSGGYAISVLAHACMVAATWVLLLAVGIDVAPAAAVWLVLAGALSLLLPITVNGLGVQEAVFVTVLSAYNVASAPALVVALLGRIIQMLFVMAGGATWLLSSRGAKTENAPSSASSGVV